MTLSTVKEIAERHRRALKSFMENRGLNNLSWAKKANISESGLRHFFNGGDSITSKNLARMAEVEGVTISTILGETPLPLDTLPTDKPGYLDAKLLTHIIELALTEAKNLNLTLSPSQEAQAISRLYEIAVIDKKANASDDELEKEAISIFRFIKHSQ